MDGKEHDPEKEGGQITDNVDESRVDDGEVDNGNIVSWDSETDTANPMNWTLKKKWIHVGIVATITFIAPLASSMFAPGVPQMMAEFHSTNQALASFVVSVYVLGFALGPLILAPLSELYGRWILYATCNTLFVVFTVACAVSSNLNMLIGFRFLAGCVGAVPLAVGGGTIADMFQRDERGLAMSLYSMGPVIGPAIGPVAGGFLSQAKGWRWIFWLLTIINGLVTINTFLFMRETYAVTILARKAKHLRKQTGNLRLRSELDKGIAADKLILSAIYRPTKMLLYQPIVMVLSLMTAMVYGYLYLLFTTFPIVFIDQYNFSIGESGLTYLGLGIGNTIGLFVFGLTSDKHIKAKAANGEAQPEHRLLLMMFGAPLIPAGLLWYGWSAQAKTQWIVPILGTGIFGIGLTLVFLPILTYLVDAYTVHAASSLAANTVLRSIVGAVLPLAGRDMYARLGLGWGNSTLAFIAVAFCPVPWGLYVYGQRLRERFSYVT